MNDYREVRIDMSPCFEDATDVAAALLADIGFETFVPDESGLTAYVKNELFNSADVNTALAEMPFDVKISVHDTFIEGQDWNKEWEKNYFKPIVVADKCVIHSTFHTDIPKADYDIVIDPKMAFGTGHHATTSQVIEAMLSIDMTDKTVIDMGTGTGILAILASMLGAKSAVGIEIDSFAYENSLDNIGLNNVDNVRLINGDASALKDMDAADVFLANINRNVITGDLNHYVTALKKGGVMILSGFYEEDVDIIMEVARPLGLTIASKSVRDRWCCLKLQY